MSLRVAINGFGRIGRNFLRAWFLNGEPDAIEVVAINDVFDVDTLAHLLAFDSTHGRFPFEIETKTNSLVINGRVIQVVTQESPQFCPWFELKVDVVLECTGQFRAYDDAHKHIEAGARKVVLGAVPFDRADAITVFGVNHENLTGDEAIVSSASCTTQCLAPLLDVLDKNFAIDSVLMTEIHAYTSDQHVLDHVHRDLRRARAAGQNIIPTTSSSIGAIQQVLPGMKGKVDGYSVRVPVQNVACVDLTVNLAKEVSAEDVNERMKTASENEYAGILGYNSLSLVSSDFISCSESAIFDSTETRAMNSTVKLLAWYDNEWGYVCRLLDLLGWMAQR